MKEGNPSKRKIRVSAKARPGEPPEPLWAEIFVTGRAELVGLRGVERSRAAADQRRINGEALRCRRVAREKWRTLCAALRAEGRLSLMCADVVQQTVMTLAEIDRASRDISRRGTWTIGERGAKKNPSATSLSQARMSYAKFAAALGLAPQWEIGLTPALGGGADDEDEDDEIFD